MNETKRLDVSDIDFESIRSNLKEYLRSQDTLRDYDFEGSALSSIVDLLSYVTHYNAVNANLGLNETFLDTAQFRGSVVGHARQLGYIPGSASAPVAYVDVSVANTTEGETLTIPRGHQFKSLIGNTSYRFITDDSYNSSDGIFENVKLVQGEIRNAEYIFDVDSNEKYIIPSRDVDLSSVRVLIYDSRNSNSFTVFESARLLTDITSDSTVYFVHENPDGFYEITFGDGVLGQALANGNVIRVEYIVTQKAAANGAAVFSSVDSIEGLSNITVSTRSPARGGGEKQTIESIKKLAPLTFASQNRAVTARDYETLIQNSFDNVRSVKAWGGEENDVPQYGKVFISINPKTSEILSVSEKEFIIDSIVKPKNVSTIIPEILDPEFLYITFEVFFKYDPSLTNLTKTALESNVTTAIREFDTVELNEFDSVFRYSNFLRAIDRSDDSILNSFARIYISRRFIPVVDQKVTYTLDYSVDLFESFGTRPVINSSSRFTVEGVQNCRFTDVPSSTEGVRTVQIVSGNEGNESVVKNNVGTIEGNKIVLTDFVPSDYEGSFVGIEAIPNSYDIAGRFNTILTIDCDCSRYAVEGSIDTIVTGEDNSGSEYRTTSKNP